MKNKITLTALSIVLGLGLIMANSSQASWFGLGDKSNNQSIQNNNPQYERQFDQREGAKHDNRGMMKREYLNQDVDVQIEYLSNGIKKTITADDQESIDQIKKQHQERNFPNPNNNIVHTIEEIENGIIVTITSEDSEEVERIKNRELKREIMKKLQEENINIADNIKQEVIKTSNGVQINLSSDNTDIMKLIQLREYNKDMHFGNKMGQKPNKRFQR